MYYVRLLLLVLFIILQSTLVQEMRELGRELSQENYHGTDEIQTR